VIILFFQAEAKSWRPQSERRSWYRNMCDAMAENTEQGRLSTGRRECLLQDVANALTF